MSMTQEPDEILFRQQANDLLLCFKHLSIFEKKQTDSSSFFFNKPNKRLYIQRRSAIIPDVKADVTVKNKLKLVPAILDLSFTNDDDGDEHYFNASSFASPFDSDILNSVAARNAKSDELDVITAWFSSQSRVGCSIDLIAGGVASVPVSLNFHWKTYHSTNEYEDTLYVHFTESDSWLMLIFCGLSDDAAAIQILNERYCFIADVHDLKYHFVTAVSDMSEYIYSVAPPLDKNSLFDLSEAYEAAEAIVDEFKENQEDPYIDAGQLDPEPLNFLSGSEDELERLLILICHAAIPMQHWNDLEPFEIYVNSASDDGESASVDYDSMSYATWANVKDRLGDKLVFVERAFDAVLDQNQPCGYTWEYNDGPYDRQSGYDRSACRLSFEISAPSAHEQICAKIEIKKLAHTLSKDTIDGLLE